MPSGSISTMQRVVWQAPLAVAEARRGDERGDHSTLAAQTTKTRWQNAKIAIQSLKNAL